MKCTSWLHTQKKKEYTRKKTTSGGDQVRSVINLSAVFDVLWIVPAIMARWSSSSSALTLTSTSKSTSHLSSTQLNWTHHCVGLPQKVPGLLDATFFWLMTKQQKCAHTYILINNATAKRMQLNLYAKKYIIIKRPKTKRSITKRKKRQVKQKVEHSTKEHRTAKCLRVSQTQTRTRIQNQTRIQTSNEIKSANDNKRQKSGDSGLRAGRDWRRLKHRGKGRLLVNESQQKTQIQVQYHDEEEPAKKFNFRGGTGRYLLISILQVFYGKGFDWNIL